jgi:hypothetical protein
MSGGSSAGHGFPPIPGQPGLPPTSGSKRSPPQTAASRHQRQASSASQARSPYGNSPPQTAGNAGRAPPPRSMTDPLPPLLMSAATSLPLRTMSNGAQADPNRLPSASRGHPPLTVNTDAARSHASKSMKLKQLAVEENQRRASAASMGSVNHGNPARSTMQARQGQAAAPYESPEVLTANTHGLPPGVFGSAKTPKTGASAAFANVASVFSAGPKRPARTDSGLPERHPRPPSVEPLDEPVRDADSRSIASKKSMKSMFGFGKKKVRLCPPDL